MRWTFVCDDGCNGGLYLYMILGIIGFFGTIYTTYDSIFIKVIAVVSTLFLLLILVGSCIYIVDPKLEISENDNKSKQKTKKDE
jgi:hypothetical protein